MPTGAAVAQIAPQGATKRTFRPDIQGLRMVAVLAVIADHLFHWPTGGFVGVDVFFVISGFLITSLLIREHQKTGTISFWGFYRRRIKRIIPAATLVIIATVAAAWFVFNKIRFDQTVIDAIWATIFGANWHFAIQGTDYFGAEAAVSPLQHYWSLSVEEQFYFVWPWLMLLIYWVVSASRGTMAHARGIILGAIVTLTALSFAWSMWETATNPTFAYFSTTSRAWELGIGAILAVIAAQFANIPPLARTTLAWVGLAGIAASLFIINDQQPFPAPWAALPVLATALVIIAGTGGEARYVWPITNPVSNYIGDISFSLYLWHFPVIIFLAEFIDPTSVTYYLAAVAIIAALSIGSYHLVEDPIRRSGWLEPLTAHERRRRARRRSNRRSSSQYRPIHYWSVGALAVVVGILVVIAFQPDTPPATATRTSPTPSPTTAADSAPGDVAALEEALQAEITSALAATEWPAISPTIDELPSIAFAPTDSGGCAPATSSGQDCASITVADPATTVAVVGNSISIAWLPAIRAVFEPRGWTVVALTLPGCPFVNANTINPAEAINAACPAHKEIVVETINRIRPAVVIASSLSGTKFEGTNNPQEDLELWGTASVEMIDRVKPNIGTFVMLQGPPRGIDPAECASRVSSPEDCEFPVSSSFRTYAALEQRVFPGEGRHYVPTLNWFCAEGRCPSFVGTTTVKRDATHLTPQYAEKLAPTLSAALVDAGVLAP